MTLRDAMDLGVTVLRRKEWECSARLTLERLPDGNYTPYGEITDAAGIATVSLLLLLSRDDDQWEAGVP